MRFPSLAALTTSRSTSTLFSRERKLTHRIDKPPLFPPLRFALQGAWSLGNEGLRERLGTPVRLGSIRSAGAARDPALAPSPTPGQRLRKQLHERLLREVEAQGAAGLREPLRVRARVRRLLEEVLATGDGRTLSPEERSRLEDELVAEVSGMGPLQALFEDPTVSDILVNGPWEVWVDRFGRLEHTSVRFDDEAHLRRLVQRLVSSHGRHLDEASPYVDVRLADGSRVNALLPPVAIEGPVVSIRRARNVPFRLEELLAAGSLSAEMGSFLAAAVRAGLNIVISGGAASGKTTLLHVLSRFIPPGERVVTIEETAELRLEHPHVVALESRLPNIEGRGEVTVRTLVRNALRMRADRLIVGEVRGGEVFDMLQAMNTGHSGSMTTVHANSPEDALRRLENLVLMGGVEMPTSAIRDLLAATVDLIVQTARFPDGARRVTAVGEVRSDAGGLSIHELYRFESRESGKDSGGRHVATGARPDCIQRLRAAGWSLAEAGIGSQQKGPIRGSGGNAG